MKQRAHAWTALRALKLVDDSGQAPKLSQLLSYYLSDVWDGAWLPDTRIVDMSYGHTFKMDDDGERLGLDISSQTWFRIPYDRLDGKLRGSRLCLEYARDAQVLQVPYRSHPKNGGHLPNRVIAIVQTIGDMFKLSDYPLHFYAREELPVDYQHDLSQQVVRDLSRSPMFSARQIAMMFFILSHYITDAHMPLHCDFRDYGGDRSLPGRLPRKLHPSIEKKWEKQFPKKETLALHDYSLSSLDEVVTRLPDGSFLQIDSPDSPYALNPDISSTVGDEWNEMVYVSRVSLAVARKWIPGTAYETASDMLADNRDEFIDVTNRIFHDAVESVARLWLKAWKRFLG